MIPTLTHGPVNLRAPRPEDADDRLRAGSDPELVRLYGGHPASLRPLTAEDACRWYERTAADPHAWAICVDGRRIGTARLHSLMEAGRHARYAVGIFSRGYWGRGHGTVTTRLVLRYAFGELGLHRVGLRVLEHNRRAIACYVKCGFVREGLERESARVNGRW